MSTKTEYRCSTIVALTKTRESNFRLIHFIQTTKITFYQDFILSSNSLLPYPVLIYTFIELIFEFEVADLFLFCYGGTL